MRLPRKPTSGSKTKTTRKTKRPALPAKSASSPRPSAKPRREPPPPARGLGFGERFLIRIGLAAVVGVIALVVDTRGRAPAPEPVEAPVERPAPKLTPPKVVFAPKPAAASEPASAPATPLVALASDGPIAARLGFETKPIPCGYESDGPADQPPPGVFDLVKYPSKVGPLAAYLTPDPKDGARHPAVLWIKGGAGGIGDFLWKSAKVENDQSAAAFREAGLVLMCPSFRGENDNPGRFELFLGEVDDVLAARDYLASRPWVDPDRIYLAGHSTGGTITLLAAEATDKFRAAFSFGGRPDVEALMKETDGKGYGYTPFDHKRPREAALRSAIRYTAALKRPTFYFEGEDGWWDDVERMAERAKAARVPFQAFEILGANHFDILFPLTRLVAKKIVADTGPSCAIRFTGAEVQFKRATR